MSMAGSGTLKTYHLLMLTYQGQKPPSQEFHIRLARWVRRGGVLLVVDNNSDPFNKIKGWWNTGTLHGTTPLDDLFARLGLHSFPAGLHKVGRGVVMYEPVSPDELSRQPHGAARVLGWLKQASQAAGLQWRQSGALVVRRGRYIVAAGLTHSVTLRGRFLSLFAPGIPLVKKIVVVPGDRFLLVDLNVIRGHSPQVVAAACRVDQVSRTPTRLSVRTDGIQNTQGYLVIKSNQPPVRVRVNGKVITGSAVTYHQGVLWVRFANKASGVRIRLQWRG
jgi:type IV secretory pathway protease TraF